MNKRYWFIGSGIFLAYAIIIHIVILISGGNVSSNFYYGPVYPILKVFKIFMTPLMSNMTNIWLIGLVIHIDVAIAYIVEGAILGWLYGKLKGRSGVVRQ